MEKKDLIAYLDEFLANSNFIDRSQNGLQVDSEKEEIKKIGYAVDASSYIFDRAIEEKVDLLLVHHGLFWSESETLVGVHYDRIKKLLKNEIALYASHLPLDAHGKVGNNIGLLKGFLGTFSLEEKDYELEEFGEYKGNMIGFGLRLKKKIDILDTIIYAKKLDLQEFLYNFGEKDFLESVCFVSGGALGNVLEAKLKNYDLFVTGEGKHSEISLAKDLKQSILLGGHYETEKIGVELLAKHLKEIFNLEIIFLDEKY